MLNYENLIGLPYIEGYQDCYGLMRRYYGQNYGLKLRNYARPLNFPDHLNLISENFASEGFQLCEISLDQLEIGDAMMFCIGRRKYVNHVGCFVGNGWMLHHLFNKSSSTDAMTASWRQRVVSVLRHPEVADQNKLLPTKVDLFQFLPPHLKAKYAEQTS